MEGARGGNLRATAGRCYMAYLSGASGLADPATLDALFGLCLPDPIFKPGDPLSTVMGPEKKRKVFRLRGLRNADT